MHGIERYGLISLLFLVVSAVAVTLWDDGDRSEPEPVVQAQEPRAQRPAPLMSQRNTPVTSSPRPSLGEDPGPLRPVGGDLETQLRLGELQRAAFEREAAAPQRTDLVAGAASADPALSTPDAGRTIPAAAPAPRTAPAETTSGYREYAVKPGDSFARIARVELGAESRLSEIAALNPRADSQRLDVGQLLKLPVGPAPERVAAAGEPATSAPAPSGARRYVVERGDVFSVVVQEECGSISRMPDVLALNPGLDPDRLQVGQEILLPAGGAPAASSASSASTAAAATPPAAERTAPPGARAYVVQPGDSFARIASRELGSEPRWKEIQALNPGVSAGGLNVGQRIWIPADRVAAASAPADSDRPRVR